MVRRAVIGLTLVLIGICCSNGLKCNNGYEWSYGQNMLYASNRSSSTPCCLKCGARCCERNVKKRIGNGDDAIQNEFPWSVAVFEKRGNIFKFKCGGVLIRSNVVLTAAHCVVNRDSKAERYYVSIGERNIFITSTGVRKTFVERLIPTKNRIEHPDGYEAPTAAGARKDVAVLRLRRASNKPIACINPEFRVKYGDNLSNVSCQAIGYGNTEAGRFSSILQKIDVQLLSYGTCKPNEEDDPDRMCARTLGGFAAGCIADSGSPVVCTDNTTPCGFSFVAGIMSYKTKEQASCDGTENILANLLDNRHDGLVNWAKVKSAFFSMRPEWIRERCSDLSAVC